MMIPEDGLQPEDPLSPARDEIARLAYSHWERQGRPQGSDLQHWLRAERELRALRRTATRLRLAVVELPD